MISKQAVIDVLVFNYQKLLPSQKNVLGYTTTFQISQPFIPGCHPMTLSKGISKIMFETKTQQVYGVWVASVVGYLWVKPEHPLGLLSHVLLDWRTEMLVGDVLYAPDDFPETPYVMLT